MSHINLPEELVRLASKPSGIRATSRRSTIPNGSSSYVACTGARDHLLVTGVEPTSEFLDDLRA